ncbi:BamA/TamA family outer membrane protein [candidate division KSB1 bacterium]|nr:BamA/TamA family outer membrane protein [candidate division KSB1 bacterium]
MKTAVKNIGNIFPYFVFCLLIFRVNSNGYAQQVIGLSLDYESSPIIEPTEQDTSAHDMENQESSPGIGAFPVIFYSDQTRWAGGAGVQLVFRGQSEQQSSTIGILAFYTQNKQYVIQGRPEIYLKEGAYKFSGEFAYLYFPDKFYGIGNNTSKDYEDYTSRLFAIKPSIQKKIYSNLYVGLQYGHYDAKLTDTEEGKLLDSGVILGGEGGVVSGAGINATWDSRDNNLYPTSGSYHQLTAVSSGPSLGSNFTFNSYLLDFRHYRPVFDEHIIAFRGVIGLSTGNPPFQMMNQLGGYLRGYKITRFVDKNLVAVQAEYRLPLFRRLGLVGFAGFGQVAENVGKISLKELKPSAGFGIRFALIPEQKVNLRIDLGMGKDDSSFDINIMEVF